MSTIPASTLHGDGSPERLAIDTIRTLSMDAVHAAKSGHIGTPMALAPVGYTLWSQFLRTDPDAPDWPNRDRFVLSVGHASMLLYSLLHLAAVKEIDKDGRLTGKPAVSLQDIKDFRQIGSKTPGHPEYRHTTGVETTTGPLGQGCGNSVGMAIAERWLAARYNRDGFPIFDHDVYCLAGDGCMMEGVASEAASLAGHLKLSNLCWIYDSNHVTIEGGTELAFDEDVGQRFDAYGWHVIHVDDANDTKAVAAAIESFKATTDRPTMIVVHSIIGYGSSIAGTAKAHGEAMTGDDIRGTKKAYGWPEDSSFLVPDGVPEHFGGAIAGRGKPLRAEWLAMRERYAQAEPALAKELEAIFADRLPDGWDAAIPTFPADEKGIATRDAGGKVLNAIAPNLPWLVGGSADLAPSTKTLIEGAGSFQASSYAGRNLHFGVREHAMGSVVNGLALSHLRPYSATFFIFLDYMRPPVRLAALMELGVTFIFTHDSIGVGEDGPTHQPIEQLTMLRATPGLDMIRPCDANEVAWAWRAALSKNNRPTALVFSRQAIPTLDRGKYAGAEGLLKGAYVLAGDDKPEIILIGTGSEVGLVVSAYERLTEAGVKARVVSMPSWYLFELQDQAYRDRVLTPGVEARLAVEMGGEIGWDRYIGAKGKTITMSTFGASAPAAKLQDKFGFTVDNLVKVARELIGKACPMTSLLKQLQESGQAPWLDFVDRSFLKEGGLRKLVEEDGLTGVTSNPSIFEKAMGQGTAYDDQYKAFVTANPGASVVETYEALAIKDIQDACDTLRPVFDRLDGKDGYVSLEVSPYLANDTDKTIAEARRLSKMVDRPNLMIKVPGTRAGVPAIRQLIEDGISINVTLLFAREAYIAVAMAFVEGLEARLTKGETIDRIASVASFFVSRIDSAIDKKIDERVAAGDKDADALKAVRGKVAIANAKLAYQWYLDFVKSDRWKKLAAEGAMPQRLLWASTGTKDPSFPDTLYIDALIGPDTVNTIPPKTMDAFRDHGTLKQTLTADVPGAEHVLAETDRLWLDLSGVTAKLVEDGVKLFADAADTLLGAIEAKKAKAEA